MRTRRSRGWLGRSASKVFAAALCFSFLPNGHAVNETTPDVVEAARPLSEGVPEVAVGRLRQLLKAAQGEEQWRAVATELVPSLIAAEQPAEALALVSDPRF